jgi:hypothetical protein
MREVFCFLLLIILVIGCKSKKNTLYTDYVLVEMTNGTKDTLTHKYWNEFTWDEYKMEWFIKHYNLNVDSVMNVKLLSTSKRKYSKKELNR